jgi:Spore germination protein
VVRRGIRLLALLAAVAALAGCASIPRTGAVQGGGSISQADNGLGPVDFIPAGPTVGATQEQILQGFVDAAVSPQGGYEIARRFLTTRFSSSWNPDASVTVDSRNSRVDAAVDDTHRTLSVTPVAFVDADGNYSRSESSAPIMQAYTFAREKGQWRIAKAPDGIVIGDAQFGDVFSAHPLYFFSPDYAYLVPDERWFPTSPPSTRARIVKELVSAGPAKWLSGAVASAFPAGSQLTIDSVPATGGVADVDLNSTAGGANPLALARMNLQLTESLTSALGVTSVRLQIEGVDASVVPLGSHTPLQNPDVDPNPLVMRGGTFGFLTGSTVQSIPGISAAVEALAPSAATLSADRSAAAVLAAGGVYAVRAGEQTGKPVDTRQGLLAPSLDNAGYVWSAATSQPGTVRATGADRQAIGLAAAWPSGSVLRAVALSRDGTRLAALVELGGRTDILVAGVVRDSHGKPTRLDQPLDLGPVATPDARSLGWLDDLDVAALGSPGRGKSVVSAQTIGGMATQTPGPEGAVVLAGATGVPPYWVLTGAGSLQSQRGNGWQQKADRVTMLGIQTGRPD